MVRSLWMCTLLVGLIAIGCNKEAGDKGEPAAVAPVEGKSTPSAETPAAKEAVTAADQKLMAEMVDMLEAVATAIDTNKSDCAKMASELESLARSSQDLLGRIEASKDNEAMERAFLAKYKPRMDALGSKMSGVRECGDEEGVTAAMTTLGFGK